MTIALAWTIRRSERLDRSRQAPRHELGIDPAFALTGGRPVGDQPDVNSPLLSPNERLDYPRACCQSVGGNENLTLGGIDRVNREARAVLLGRKQVATAAPERD